MAALTQQEVQSKFSGFEVSKSQPLNCGSNCSVISVQQEKTADFAFSKPAPQIKPFL